MHSFCTLYLCNFVFFTSSQALFICSPQKLKNLCATYQVRIPAQTHWCYQEGHCFESCQMKKKCSKFLILHFPITILEKCKLKHMEEKKQHIREQFLDLEHDRLSLLCNICISLKGTSTKKQNTVTLTTEHNVYSWNCSNLFQWSYLYLEKMNSKTLILAFKFPGCLHLE